MYLEYEPMTNTFRPRFGDRFIDVRGVRSYYTMAEAREQLKACGLKVGRKTDSRTWKIVTDDSE